MKRIVLLLLVLVASLTAAFSQTAVDLTPAPEHSKVRTFANKLVNYLEERELSGVDTSYVGAPKYKWAVFANTYLSQLDFDLRSNGDANKVDYVEGIGKVTVDMRSKVETQVSLGLYFMGYGLSYSQDLNKGYKKNLSFTMYSSPVGGEFRYHTTDRIHGKLAAKELIAPL